jgi:hypothetical protein
MKARNTFGLLGLGLWIAASWFFYLGYTSDLVAIAMFFIPIVPSLGSPRTNQAPKQDLVATILTLCYLGLGAGLVESLDSIGGLSYLVGVLFGNTIVMVTTNTIFALHIHRSLTDNDLEPKHAVV